jgi:hypothetical protein
MSGSHTADAVQKIFDDMLEEWGIGRDRLHVILRDEGTNMKKVCEYLCGVFANYCLIGFPRFWLRTLRLRCT